MEILKAEKTIYKTRPDFGKCWLVFAAVVDYGIHIQQKGFSFYTKKEAVAFCKAHP